MSGMSLQVNPKPETIRGGLHVRDHVTEEQEGLELGRSRPKGGFRV